MLENRWIADACRCIRFPDTKTGKQTRIIGEAAAQVIKRQQKLRCSTFVFPADDPDGTFIELSRDQDFRHNC